MSIMSLASPFMSPKASTMAESTKSSAPSVINNEHFQEASINGHDSVPNGAVSENVETHEQPTADTKIEVQATVPVPTIDEKPVSEAEKSSVPDDAGATSNGLSEESTKAVPPTQDGEVVPPIPHESAVPNGTAGIVAQSATYASKYAPSPSQQVEPVQEAAAVQSAMYASKYAPPPPQQAPAHAPRGPAFADQFQQIPRAPRRGGYNGNHRPQYDLHDNVRTLEAKLLKANQKINDEREAHKAALAQARKDCEIAVEKLADDVLVQKIRVAHKEENVRKQELDLEARKILIRNIETILAIGQKQFADAEAGIYRNDEEFINVNEEIIRERVAHEVARRDRKIEAHLATKARELELREADLEMRQKGYEPLLVQKLEKLEAKIRGDVEGEIAARVGKAEYDRGFAEGKTLGNNDAAFDRGYAACFTVFERVKRFQAGLLARDSPEMAFFFDTCHPENPFSRGVHAGRHGLSLSDDLLAPTSQTATLPTRTIPNGVNGFRPHNGTNGFNGYGTGTTSSPYSSDQTPRSNTTTFPPARMNGNGNGTAENGESNHAQVPKEDEPVPLIDL